MTGVMTLSAKAAVEMPPDTRNSRQIYLYGSSRVRILITTHMGYQVIPSDSLEVLGLAAYMFGRNLLKVRLIA
jgi:hypothetical protein